MVTRLYPHPATGFSWVVRVSTNLRINTNTFPPKFNREPCHLLITVECLNSCNKKQVKLRWKKYKTKIKNDVEVQETRVQSQVESCQRLKKWYLIPPCLTLSIRRKGSRVKWNNRGNGVVPSPTPWCSSLAIEKGAFGLPSTTVANFTLGHDKQSSNSGH